MIVLLGLFAIQFWLNKRFLFAPLTLIRNQTNRILAVDKHLGEEIPLPFGRELNELTTAFNAMLLRLRMEIDHLEERVREPTSELKQLNDQLEEDISKRKQVEEEREKLISELQEALAKVKTLTGLLPICASCKKIRDDKGYWNQIEAYIRDHSEAEFSHGICPECMKKPYPDV